MRPLPSAGGCTFAEDPDRPARDARLVWSSALDPGVLRAVALPCPRATRDSSFALDGIDECVLVARGKTEEHITIGRGARSLRLDIEPRNISDSSPLLELHIAVGPRLRCQAIALGSLLALHRGDSLAAWRPPSDPRLPRLVTALRVLDALCAGASLRRIGDVLLPDRGADWPGSGESAKSRVRRIVALARRLELGGAAAILSQAI